MSDTPPSSRPKIQVVRLPSYEQAKLRPLLEGGVQLQAQFQHMRYGDYASCSSLDDANKQCFRYRTRRDVINSMENKINLRFILKDLFCTLQKTTLLLKTTSEFCIGR
jgi:hypothetical protein